MKAKSQLGISFFILMFFLAFKTEDFAQLLQNKFNAYFYEKTDTQLFIHTDKNIYFTNENIWFKAYVFSKSNLASEVLFLRLVDTTQKIVLEKKFPVYDVRSHGEITLPDTLRQGRYLLYAFTDNMINFNPNQIFVQQIEIKKTNNNFLDIATSIKDTLSLKANSLVKLNFKVKLGKENVQKAKVSYQIKLDDGKVIQSDKLTTDFTGNANLDFTFPSLNPDDHLFISGSVTNDSKKTDFNVELPNYHHFLNIDFYPESGNLIDGLNQLKVVTTNEQQKAIAAKVNFKEDGKSFAQFNTNVNGFAFPKLNFKKDRKYTVEVSTNKHQKTINFPLQINPKAFQITLNNNNGLHEIAIRSYSSKDKVWMVLRSNNQIVLTKELDFSEKELFNLPFSEVNLDKGIFEVSLINQQSEVLTQRLFYKNVKDWYSIKVNFKKKIYETRDQVTGEIEITDNNNNPVEANLSVAVVAESHINTSFFNRIDENYFAQLNKEKLNLTSSSPDFNNFLIGKKWENVNWEQVINYKPSGTLKLFKNAGGLMGKIEQLKGKPIKIKELYLIDKGNILSILVDDEGSFQIFASNLVTQSNNKPYLVLGDDFFNQYNFKLNSYTNLFDTRVKFLNLKTYFRENIASESPSKLNLSMLNNTTVLNEVVVKANRNEVEYNSGIYTSKNCLDYVCFNNILNCPNHKTGGFIPTDGGVYQFGGRAVVYKGCGSQDKKETNIALDNIFLPQNFYLPNYQQMPKEIKELATTLYWNPNLNTNNQGKASFSYYNSDFKGNFKIIIQGVENQTLRPLFAQSAYLVSNQ